MSTNLPSFDRAEYLPAPGSPKIDRCAICREPVAGSYYRVNGEMTCGACATSRTPVRSRDTHAVFMKALTYGAVAALVGMIGYALFTIVTGIFLAYIAIGVGYIVGKAMKAGSKGVGGKRYQIAAIALTYAAISVAAVPIAIQANLKGKPAAVKQAAPGTQAETDHPFPGDAPAAPAPKPRMGVGMVIVTLIGIGLASPFMELAEGFHGVIGLIILAIGMGAAWRETAEGAPGEADVSGPYECAPA